MLNDNVLFISVGCHNFKILFLPKYLFLPFQEFLATDPILSEFKAEILHYEKLEQEIEDIGVSIRLGAIELFTGN